MVHTGEWADVSIVTNKGKKKKGGKECRRDLSVGLGVKLNEDDMRCSAAKPRSE